ncbi:MAG: MFS transporter, partial [Candidatus Subteraquimicrobiales bacterium]|nr:MFS transporter [Candidatus Subteraquimicrobiales bacterium]
AFLLETMALFFTPAKDAILPNLVKREHLLVANSLSYTTTQLTMVLGLGFGSTIVLVVEKIWGHLPFFRDLAGPHAVFYIDAFSFFVSALTIFMIRTTRSNRRSEKIKYSKVKDELQEGIRFLKENPTVRAMIMSVGVAIFGGGSLYTLGVVYLDQVLKVSPGAIGPILTALAVGMLGGALAMSYFGRVFSKRFLFTFFIFAFGFILILFATITYYEVAMFLIMLGGIALGSLTVVGRTYLQENVRDEVRGRIFVALESVLRVSLFISMAFAGVVADIIGQRVFTFGGLTFIFNGAQTTLVLGGSLVILASYFAFKTIKSEARG